MIPVTRPTLPTLDQYMGYLQRIWQTKWLTNNGDFSLLLEQRLREYLGVKNMVLVSNGTLALNLALKSLDLQGEVITTPFTFVATTNSIVWEGLTPIFADIDAETFNINPEDVEKKITEKTCAILAVHVYGNPCDVKSLATIASDHGLKLLYDGAHSFGVEYGNRSIFDYGDVSTLSFHATKVYNTIEGGALVTCEAKLAEELRLLRDHGIISAEEFIGLGINAKMNEFQAAMGLCNLELVDQDIEMRKTLYKLYISELSSGKLRFQRLVCSKYNYAYMPVCFEDERQRNRVCSELSRRGFGSRKYFYPLTVSARHFMANQNLIYRFGLQVASDVARRILCLPLYPGLKLDDVYQIVNIIREIVA
jgi:dTDP-4-amino-4,6-dideoxygalactose transaminase